MANSDYAVKTTLYRRNDSITDTAFLSKGDLRDIDIYRYDCPKVVPDSDILTETLWSQEPLSFDNGFDYVNIYRAYIYESDENNETSSVKSTDWYLTSSEAYGHMQELYPGIEKQDMLLVFGSVHRPMNQPLVLPCRGILEDGKKGHVLRLETNPMENGSKSKGKYFFPDRKCSDIIPGPVEITSINEKATYGFFIGHNIQFQWPDEAKLADYLLDCKTNYENSGPWTFDTLQKLRFYDSPHFGKFIEFDDRFLVAGKDGSVETVRLSDNSHLPKELLGDPNQLLSVGAGNILSDLLTLGVPSICLQQQYRQSTDAAALRQNVVDFPKLNGEHELRWDDSFRLLPADDRAIPDLLCEEAARRYRAGESIQVLSPVRVKTGFSVQALNTRLQNEVNPLTAEKPTWGKFRDGDRVIVTQNSAYYNICNGDVGVLHIRGEKSHRVAVLAVRGTLKTWQIDRGQGEYGIGYDDAPPPQLALAYALTVHKSQGSQYDTVLMPVSMATARMLYRNLLYTAISRAGKEVILVGNREALNTAMQCIPYPRKSKLIARTNLLRLGRSA